MRHYYDAPEPASATDLLQLGKEMTAAKKSLQRAQKRREAATLFERTVQQKRLSRELHRLERRLDQLATGTH